MWEPANPRERADFEEDVIASTNENLYQNSLFFSKGSKGFAAYERDDFFRMDLDNEFQQRAFLTDSMFDRDPVENDFELDLEMNDLLDEFNLPSCEDTDDDIFAIDRDNCATSTKKKGD